MSHGGAHDDRGLDQMGGDVAPRAVGHDRAGLGALDLAGQLETSHPQALALALELTALRVELLPEVVETLIGRFDALTRLAMQAELIRIWKETAKTILFVTHDIDEAIIMADRVIVMTSRPSRVKEEITVDLPRPRHRDDPKVGALTRRIANLLGVAI